MIENETPPGEPTAPDETPAGVAPGGDPTAQPPAATDDSETSDASVESDVEVETKPVHNANAEIQYPPLTPNNKIPKIKDNEEATTAQQLRIGESLVSFSATTDDINRFTDSYKTADMSRGASQRNWLETVKEGFRVVPHAKAFLGSVDREDGMWRQEVRAGAEKVRAGAPQFAESVEPGDRLTGERAVMRIQGLLKLGQTIRAPLWHTGIWLTFKAPTESALLELERRISNEKILLGRRTHGSVFSNSSVYINSFLVNFALAHVYDSTLRYKEIDDLKKVIRVTDIPLMVWGLLSTMYPSGYPHMQPCVKDPSKCTHITEELISIGKLMWTDERALTEKQRRHMTKKTDKFDAKDLEAYQEDHRFNDLATIQLSDSIAMEARVPTIHEFEVSGFEWVDNIVRTTDNAFGGTMKGEERNEYILQSAQITALRQYGHYIKRIVLQGTEIIDDRQTIEDTLSTLTSDPDIYDKFFNGIGKFIDNSAISLIALPKYDCPNCGADDSEDVLRSNPYPYLIPLDVAQVFFILLDQRLLKILSRSQN